MTITKNNVNNYLRSKYYLQVHLKGNVEWGCKVVVNWNAGPDYDFKSLSSTCPGVYYSREARNKEVVGVDYKLVTQSIDKSANKAPKWFDSLDYLMENKDLFDNAIDPVEHYLNHGIREGRNPSPFFSEQKYLELNPDVKKGVQEGHLTSGYMHYMEHGCREERSPDGIFNEGNYLDLNDDIDRGIQEGHLQCGFIHCIQHGLEEGRLGCADVYPVD